MPSMPAVVHRFEAQDSTQTLEEGLAEYLSANANLKRGADLQAPEAPPAIHLIADNRPRRLSP